MTVNSPFIIRSQTRHVGVSRLKLVRKTASILFRQSGLRVCWETGNDSPRGHSGVDWLRARSYNDTSPGQWR